MNTISTPAAKEALRQRMLAARAALPSATREAASCAIAARVAALPAWREARTVALHAALGSEVATAELARLALAEGKRVAWPRIAGAERALEFAVCELDALVPGPARALEPPASAPALPRDVIDLAVVPGVAFDDGCARLGRGRGHYDATLALLPRGTFRLGLAFAAQIVPRVPVEPHDIPLDAVVTEERVLLPSTERRPG